MIETLTIITLATLALIIFRPGKTEPLENPLVINRVGQFHAVLAPRINLAQPLLESISRELPAEVRQSGDTRPLYFKVSDREVRAHGKDHYLLAATLRGGILYFQAAAPEDGRSELEVIRNFSEAELSHHPEPGSHSADAERALKTAIHIAAGQRGSHVGTFEDSAAARQATERGISGT